MLLSRLVFLAADHRPPTPPKSVLRYLPQGEVIAETCRNGITGLSIQHDVSLDQARALYEAGSAGGRGSIDEFKLIVADAVSNELQLQRPNMTLSLYIAAISALHGYLNGGDNSLIEVSEIDLSEPVLPETMAKVAKWSTGYTPLDLVTGGLYQGIITMLGTPGAGKTTHLLRAAEDIRASDPEGEMLLDIYSLEMPLPVMELRLVHTRRRIDFVKGDRLSCGLVSTADVLDRLKSDPEAHRRVVIFDGPDVSTGGQGDLRRFALEDAYRDLVRIKSLVKCVLTTSQVRRKEGSGYAGMSDVAESWQKAWYSDVVVSVTRGDRDPMTGYTKCTFYCSKNRLGMPDVIIPFKFAYDTLQWQIDDSDRPSTAGYINSDLGYEDF